MTHPFTFIDANHLKQWLRGTQQGKAIVNSLLDGWPPVCWRHMLAVQHKDHVALYGQGISMRVVTQVDTQSSAAERYAEAIMENEVTPIFRELLWPSRCRLDRPGLVGTVSNTHRTVQEYEWWQAYRSNCTMLDNLQDKEPNRADEAS